VRLRVIKPRVGRLKELLAELCQDFIHWQEDDSPLLDGERRTYLRGIQEAIAGVDEASVVLAGACDRFRHANDESPGGGFTGPPNFGW